MTWRLTFLTLSHIYMTAHFLNPITYIHDGIFLSHIYMTVPFLNPITYIHDGISLSQIYMTGYSYHIYTWRDIPITYIHDGIYLSHIYMTRYPYHIYTWRDISITYIHDGISLSHIYMTVYPYHIYTWRDIPITYIHDGSLSSLVGIDTSIKQTSWGVKQIFHSMNHIHGCWWEQHLLNGWLIHIFVLISQHVFVLHFKIYM